MIHPVAPFDQVWSLDDTRAALAHQRARPALTTTPEYNDWRQVHHEVWIPKLNHAIGAHVRHQARHKGLQEPPHSQDVDLPWLHEWRALCRAESLEQINLWYVPHQWQMSLFHRLSPAPNEVCDAEKVHQDLVDFMEEGMDAADPQWWLRRRVAGVMTLESRPAEQNPPGLAPCRSSPVAPGTSCLKHAFAA